MNQENNINSWKILNHSNCVDCNKLKRKLAKAVCWLVGKAYCPCCEQTTICLSDCTFKDDDPLGFNEITEVRKLIKDLLE